MSLKKFLKKALKSKTVHGVLIAAGGPSLIPLLLENAPSLLNVLGVAPGTAGKVVGVAGALYAIYGRAKAQGPLTGA